MTTTLDHPADPTLAQDAGTSTTTEASLISRFVALLTPFFAVAAGAIAAYVAKHIPGVALDQTQIAAFMVAVVTAALSASWKWTQGWQQHEQLVAAGKTDPVKAPKSSAN